MNSRTEPVTAPGLGASRQQLLGALKRLGPATIPTLALELGLNVETVRHHLQALGALELVQRRGTRSHGPGRPEVVYALTGGAEPLFPRREGEVLRSLAQFLVDGGHESLLHAFFERYIAERRDAALARVTGLRGRARVQEAARILSELGFIAEATGDGGGLRLCHCPMQSLVEVTRAPCRAEIAFVRELLGGGLARLSYIPAGDASCTYAREDA